MCVCVCVCVSVCLCVSVSVCLCVCCAGPAQRLSNLNLLILSSSLLGQWDEPVWPSGKALYGWEAEGPRFDSASVLLSLKKGCGFWTLSCDFVPQNQ